MRYLRLLIPALMLTLGAVACGDDDTDSGTDSGTDTTGDEAEITDEEGVLDFYACMRDEGVDLPDPDPDQQGIRLPELTTPEEEAAMEICRSLLPSGGEMPEVSADDLESIRAFVGCMQDAGLDIPDPNADGSISMPADIDPNTAEFQTAMEECQALLNGAPILMGSPQ